VSGLISLQKEIALLSSTKLQVDDEFTNHHVSDSPLSNTFRLNFKSMVTTEFGLLRFKYVTFDKVEWTYNPALFCYDYYTDASLDRIILLVNGMKSMFDFKSTNFESRRIIAPSADIIYQILSNR